MSWAIVIVVLVIAVVCLFNASILIFDFDTKKQLLIGVTFLAIGLSCVYAGYLLVDGNIDDMREVRNTEIEEARVLVRDFYGIDGLGDIEHKDTTESSFFYYIDLGDEVLEVEVSRDTPFGSHTITEIGTATYLQK